MATFSWTLQLKDAMSSVASRASKSLNGLSGSLKKAGKIKAPAVDSSGPKKLGLFGRAVQAVGKTFGQKGVSAIYTVVDRVQLAGQRLGSVWDKAKGAFSAVKGPILAVGGALLAIGGAAGAAAIAGLHFVVDAQQFKQSTLFAFKNLLGGQNAANAAWNRAKQTSLLTGQGLQETASGLNKLLAVGFSLDQADTLQRQLADLAALNPAANLEGIVTAIGQIKNTGKLQGDELLQLADAGLSTDKVYEQLGKRLGKTRAEVLKLQGAGKISATDAIAAIQASIAAQTGKAPGKLAEEATKSTLSGALGKLGAVRDALVDSVHLNFKPVTKFLDKVGTALNGPGGKKLVKSVESAFDAIVSGLDKITAADLDTTLALAAGTFDALGSAAKATWAVITGFLGALTWVRQTFADAGVSAETFDAGLRGLLSASTGLLGNFSAISSVVSSLSGEFSAAGSGLGSAIIAGLESAVLAGISPVANAVASVADSAIAKGKSVLGVHSPSTVFRGIGLDLTSGLSQGVMSGKPQAADAAKSLSNEVVASGRSRVDALQFDSSTLGGQAATNISRSQATNDNSRSFAPIITLNMNGAANDAGKAVENALRSLNLAFA